MTLAKQQLQKKSWFWFIVCIILGAIITLIIYTFIERKNNPYILGNEPFEISYHSNVLSEEEAAEIIAWAKPKMERSLIGGNSTIHDDRTSSTVWLPHNTFVSTKRIVNFVSKLTGIPPTHFEDFQVIHYNVGQKYNTHYDPCYPKSLECVRGMGEDLYGVRQFTFFIYLNDVEKGGETIFPVANVKVQPKRGKALLWRNTMKDGSNMTNKNALHAGLPPLKGEKWAINLWVRTKSLTSAREAKRREIEAEKILDVKN